MEAPAIGIDLGTTYSCVAVFQNEKSHVIEIKNGLNTMASVVSYTKTGRLVGDAAKENSAIDPTATIYGVKRFMGYTYKEMEKKELNKNYPVEIINENDQPKFQIVVNGDLKRLSPEEISVAILERLKKCAEIYLKMEVKNAVITVPAHFNDAQRTATRNAGRIAGLEVLRIINEPTAAALAYGLDQKYANKFEKCNVLVYDFGGGTFDVSIINIDDGVFEVKATDGDTHLGGDDIDELLVAYFVQEINSQYGVNVNSHRRTIRRLRLQCEKMKKKLSTTEHASIDIDRLVEDKLDFCSSMNRLLFETMCTPIIKKTINLMENALKEAKMNINDIDEVILVGGTTRIPKVREMVQKFIKGKQLNLSLNPDEAVAIGASVQAAILDQSNTSEIIGGIVLLDVNSLSLGIETVGGVMSVIIPRNTPIPVEITEEYSNVYDYQTSVSIAVYEGERKKVSENSLLGSFILTGMTKALRKDIRIYVKFSINTDGILCVTATESINRYNTNNIDIVMDQHRFSDEDIARMIREAEKYRKEDEKWAEQIDAKFNLEKYCLNTIQMINEEFMDQMLEGNKQIVLSKCREALVLLERDELQSKEYYEQKQKEVHNVCFPIIQMFM